ncbi:hypothetical protein R84B8_01435 [Treponema sp. R8-4-B8]
MEGKLGSFLWKISVALYLIANGVLGLVGSGRGDFSIIFGAIFGKGSGVLVTIASVIALIAGIAILLEMCNVQLSFLDSLILIIAIIWAVYVIVEIVAWITGKYRGSTLWEILQRLAVHLMVLSSLLIASKKF